MEDKIRVLEAMIQFGKPVSAGEIAQLADLEGEAVDKALAEMNKDGAVAASADGKWEPVNGTM